MHIKRKKKEYIKMMRCYEHVPPTELCPNHALHHDHIVTYSEIGSNFLQAVEEKNVKDVDVSTFMDEDSCCEWEGVCKLKFLYMSGEDAVCQDAMNNVWFIKANSVISYEPLIPEAESVNDNICTA